MNRHVFAGALFLAFTVPGCGLISSDITQFDLSLPDQEFTIDTTQWGLSADAAFPGIPCDPADDICEAATASVCSGGECTGICDAELFTCKLSVTVALSESINLVDEKPELQTIEDQPFIEVTIDSVNYRVDENTLNFPSPEINLYVAPQNIMSPESAEARLVGTIESVPAMRQLEWTPMSLTNTGEGNLRDMMGDYRSVFNVIVGATVEVSAGQEMPTGRAVARVAVDAHAGL